MRVGFNARLLYSPSLRGWNRYAVNLLAGLQELGCETVLYSDQPLHESHLSRMKQGSFLIRTKTMKYPLWEQGWLSWQTRKDGVDVLHSPFHFGLPYYSHCPRVVTLHDVIDATQDSSQHKSWNNPRASRAGLEGVSHLLNLASRRIARSRANHIITVSHHSKLEITERFGVSPDRVSVTYEAAEPRFEGVANSSEQIRVCDAYGLSSPYFFYIGGWEERKNVPFLIRSFMHSGTANVDLAIAGTGSPAQRETLLDAAKYWNGRERIRVIGRVADEDLPALYAGALAFVYPSRHEGFGLQLCEAMSAGCPVLAARASCLPEILGDGGKTFSLDDPAELAGLLRSIAASAEIRRDLSGKGRKRARYFDWRRTAEQTVAIYRRLITHGAGVPQHQAAVTR